MREFGLSYRKKKSGKLEKTQEQLKWNKGIIIIDKHEIQKASRNGLLEMTYKLQVGIYVARRRGSLVNFSM